MLEAEVMDMISDEQLDEYRVAGTMLRVIRDANEANDVRGIVVAWDNEFVMIRKMNRRLLKLDRRYVYQPYDEERPGGIESILENR